jgi:Tfp pilus assembly protein PilX
MKKLKPNQQGFIPMIIMLILMLVAAIVFAYMRVKAKH